VDAVALATPGATEAERPKGSEPGSRTNGQLWIEVLAVLCLAYLPYLVFVLVEFVQGSATRQSLTSRELYLILTGFQISSPLLVIMALGRDPWAVFGIVRPSWMVDAFGGYVVWMAGVTASILVKGLLPQWVLDLPAPPHVMLRPESVPACFLLFAGCAAGAFSEELVMRGYLIPRLEYLLRSTWIAVLISTAMYASYHIYHGVVGAIGVGATGLVYAVSFCLLRRLWPVCLAHTLHNFVLHL
jgi:membrane protease YdiL (CAAX protease family)